MSFAAAYLQTRVALKAQHLMSEAVFQRMTERPIEDILGGLREPMHIRPERGDGLDLDVLERNQLRSLFDDFAVLVRPLNGVPRELLLHWSRHLEFLNLKTLVRGKLHHLPGAELRPRLFDLGRFSVLDYDRLVATEDIAELLRQLAETPCAGAARQVRHALATSAAPFHLDAILDRYYHTTLMAKAAASGSNGLQRLAGTLTDAKNLVWLLRYRFRYALSPTDTYFVLTPAGELLDQRALSRLVGLESLEQVLAALPATLATALAGADTPTEVERRLDAHSMAVARELLPRARFVVARAFAYLILRELDMLRLLAVLRGKALGLDSESIRYATGTAHV